MRIYPEEESIRRVLPFPFPCYGGWTKRVLNGKIPHFSFSIDGETKKSSLRKQLVGRRAILDLSCEIHKAWRQHAVSAAIAAARLCGFRSSNHAEKIERFLELMKQSIRAFRNHAGVSSRRAFLWLTVACL